MRISTKIAAVVLAATVGFMPAIASAQQYYRPGADRPAGPGFRAGGPAFGPGVRRPPPTQFRSGGRVYQGGPVYRGGRHYGGRAYYGGRYYRDDDYDGGAALAAGIVGLAAGAMIAGAASGGGGGHVDRCLRRYRSYDPDSDTYRGYDGRLHRCRL